jgi:hypothetical protein
MRVGNTGTYENTIPITPDQLSAVLTVFWNTAAQHSGPGTLDHFWMYCDQ